MKGLYRGKYIIAIYDKDDYLIDVACMPTELLSYDTRNVAESLMSKIFNGKRKCNRVYFIDVTKRYKDVFIEEDRLFLKEVKKWTIK